MAWRTWFGRRDRSADIDAEIDGHIQMATRDRIERGEPPEQARRHALLELAGALTQPLQLARSIAEEVVGLADHHPKRESHDAQDLADHASRRRQAMAIHGARDLEPVRSSTIRFKCIGDRADDDFEKHVRSSLSMNGDPTYVPARTCTPGRAHYPATDDGTHPSCWKTPHAAGADGQPASSRLRFASSVASRAGSAA